MSEKPEALCVVDFVFVVDVVRNLPSRQSQRMTQSASHKVHKDSIVHKVAGDHTRKVERFALDFTGDGFRKMIVQIIR
jgi:hypothetical protein